MTTTSRNFVDVMTISEEVFPSFDTERDCSQWLSTELYLWLFDLFTEVCMNVHLAHQDFLQCFGA